ncbi:MULTISPECIES: FAD-dependent oxidoreductase [unclassified Nocardia]|nr:MULTISPECIES: FAD-dependent oxidoreductase [unclassified Nocardia]
MTGSNAHTTRLHFAGTELDPDLPGWIEGAVRSGYRAAAEIARAL